MDGWFRLADQMHWQGTISELMKKISYREYLARLEWIDRQWNEPSRTDYYLMQIAEDVELTRLKSARSKKITFEKKPVKKPVTFKTRKEAADASRARWIGIIPMTKKKEQIRIPRKKGD